MKKKGEGHFFWFIYLMLAIVLVGLPACLAIVPFFLIGRLFSPKLEKLTGLFAAKAINLMMLLNRFWLNPKLELDLPPGFGVKMEQGAILVSNHRSHLDVFFLISSIPNIRILAKAKLFWIPFLGMMMWVMRQISVRSNQGVFAAYGRAKKRVESGDPVHFFIEGTRAKPEDIKMGRVFDSAFRLAFDCNLPVYPIVFFGTDAVWPKDSFRLRANQRVVVRSLAACTPHFYESPSHMLDKVKSQIDLEYLKIRNLEK